MIRRFCNRCDGVIVPTFSTEEYLRLIGVKSRICVQPTGVDFDKFNQPHVISSASLRKKLGLKHDDIVLLSVSRLGKEKNIKFLLDALEALPRLIQLKAKLVVVGEGDDREYLQNRIAQKGLSGVVQLIGEITPGNIPAYYQMADIFVFASKSETQGMVILEAMSAGLPVVAIRSSGIDDVIEDGKTGFKTLDDVEVWPKKLAELINDKSLRQHFSHNAVNFARQHDISEYVKKIDLFYSEILATHAQQNRA
jgi:glycosyltransferase involved in cell wall biosynthesis